MICATDILATWVEHFDDMPYIFGQHTICAMGFSMRIHCCPKHL